jgi:hypothetical protein
VGILVWVASARRPPGTHGIFRLQKSLAGTGRAPHHPPFKKGSLERSRGSVQLSQTPNPTGEAITSACLTSAPRHAPLRGPVSAVDRSADRLDRQRETPPGARVYTSVWARRGRASAITAGQPLGPRASFPTSLAVPVPFSSLPLSSLPTPRIASSPRKAAAPPRAREGREEGAGMRMLSKACSIVASSLPRCSSSSAAAPTVASLSPHYISLPLSPWFSSGDWI